MKILITGSSGQLGSDLVRVLSDTNEVLAFSHPDLDVTDFDKTKDTIVRLSPDILIHTAACTDVDGCELDPNRAYKVNALGTQNVALGCQKMGAQMVYISTDYVFDGKRRESYTEFDEPNPLSVYGLSKLAGERYVMMLLNGFFIIRTSWLYGKQGKNFVKTILGFAEERDELKIVDDQVGSPTYTYDLAQKIGEVIKTGAFGLYHITNSESCSWYQFARDILQYAGKKNVEVRPITSEELKRPAPRPAFSVLRNYCLELRNFSLMRHYKEALKEYLTGKES